jgi:diguanylate cyclase (GGDEF)-like protein
MAPQVSHFAAGLKGYGILAACATVAVAVLVELGWALHVPWMKGLSPGGLPMQPLTAALFMLTGTSLLLALTAKNAVLYWLHKILAVVVFLGGVGVVAEYLLEGRISQWPWLVQTAVSSPPAALGSACNFILLALALLLRGYRPLRLVVSFTAVAVLLDSLVALYGYILGVPSLYSMLFYNAMALITALLFFLLSLASLGNNPYGWVVQTVFSEGSGGRLSRWLLPFTLFGPALLSLLFELGVKQELYHSEFGEALLAMTMAVSFSLLTLFFAYRTNVLDALRRSKEALEKSHQELRFFADNLTQANIHLERLSATDPLTELPNRRVFNLRLEEELARSHRYGLPLSILMLDVDNFKSYNDSFGHPAGDEVLKTIAYLLTQSVREVDCVARLGGEEFGVVMPETDKERALALAERIRYTIACASWPKRTVTVSLGVATLARAANTAEVLVAEADAALYEAKRSGRNRVIGARPRPPGRRTPERAVG